MTDPFDLQRFLDAQAPVYAQVLAELRRGQKQSHWMWFIFPQLAGLGHSAMAQRFAIASREEAVAYLGHAVLGARLKECTALIRAVEGRTVREILGSPDDLKIPVLGDIVQRGVVGSGILRSHCEVLRRKARPKDAGSTGIRWHPPGVA